MAKRSDKTVLNNDWKKVIPKKLHAEYERRVQAGEAVTHFCPGEHQEHFGRKGVPLCDAPHPTYVGDWVLSTGTNTIENVTCKRCLRMHDVRNRLCRGCNTMITTTSLEKYRGLCPGCKGKLETKIGIIDLDKDNKIVGLHGAASKDPKGSEAAVAEYIERKRLAAEAKEAAKKNALAAKQNGGYTDSRGAANNPTPAVTGNAEEDTMGKGNPDALKKAREAKAEKSANTVAGYDKGLKVKVLNKECPHREGSTRAEAFASILKAKTVGDYEGKAKYLHGWIESGHIKVG